MVLLNHVDMAHDENNAKSNKFVLDESAHRWKNKKKGNKLRGLESLGDWIGIATEKTQ